MFTSQVPDKCERCGTHVHAAEKVACLIRRAVVHVLCFKCAVCGTYLTMKTFHSSEVDGRDRNVYCSSHKRKQQGSVCLSFCVSNVSNVMAGQAAHSHEDYSYIIPLNNAITKYCQRRRYLPMMEFAAPKTKRVFIIHLTVHALFDGSSSNWTVKWKKNTIDFNVVTLFWKTSYLITWYKHGNKYKTYAFPTAKCYIYHNS